MRARCPLLILALATAVTARADTLAALEAEQTALYERVAPGVVVVLSRGLLGAGVAVSPGVVMTGSHLVPADGEVDVVLRDGSRVHGTLLERADGVDAALVRIPAAPRPLELGFAGTRPVRTRGDGGELALAVMGWSALVGLGVALVAARRYR